MSEIIARVKKSLKAVEHTLENEPVVLIDAGGRHWLNDIALELISKKGIPLDDFMEWLKIGSAHLQRLVYFDIHIHMMRLPGNDVIVFLKQECPQPSSENFDLTLKEREVLRHLVKGLSNKEIATHMKLSPGTVNSHLDNIYTKLGCSNRLVASFVALKHGLFLPSRRTSPKKRG